MNKERRKRIADICDKLVDLMAELDQLAIEEEEAYEALPESFQSTERGDKIQDAVSTLGDCSSDLDNVIQALQEL